MSGVKDVIRFLLEYFSIYMVLIPGMAGMVLGLFYYIRKQDLSIVKKAFLLPLVMILCVVISYNVYRMAVLPGDEVSIYCEKDSQVTLEKYTSSNRNYSCGWSNEGSEDYRVFRVARGFSRNLIFKKGQNFGLCKVVYDNEVFIVDLNAEYEGKTGQALPSSYMEEILLELAIKIFLNIFVNIGIAYAVCKLSEVGLKNRIFKLYQEYKNAVVVFMVLFIDYLLNRSDAIDSWVSCWYAVDYSMGFGSRFLVGTILSIFYDDFLTKELAYRFCSFFIVLLIFCIALLLNKVMKCSKKKYRTAVFFLIGCFLCCPGSVSAMWTETQYGRLELYLLLVSFLMVVIFNKMKNIYIRYVICVAFSCIASAIYQGYIFLYFPIFVMIMVCDIFEKENQKKKVLLSIGSCVWVIIFFLVFQFGTYVDFQDVDDMYKIVSSKTDLYINKDTFYYECFAPISAAYKNLNLDFLRTFYLREKTFLIFALMLPIVVVVCAIYIKCFSITKEKGEKIWKTPYLYFILIQIIILPQFILNIDWGRWMTAITVNTFFGIFYLCYKHFREMESALEALTIFIEKHSFVAIMTIVYLASYSKLESLPSMIKPLWDDICITFGI